MRGWCGALVVSLAVAAVPACGRTPTRARASSAGDDEAAQAVPRALPRHDAYEVLARTRITFGEHELATLRSRLHLYVEERGRRGVSLRARVFRIAPGDEAATAFSDVEVALDRRGGMAHDPLSLCDDPDVDDLSPTRVVRHVLGSLAPWDGGRDGSLTFSFSEVDAPVEFHYREGEDGIEAHASTSAHLGSFAIAGWRIHADGDAHVRVEEQLDVADALLGRTHLSIDVVATVTDVEGRSRSGILEVASDVVSRVATFEPSPPETCESGFSPDDVVRAIDARRGDIRECYERALLTNPTLRGHLAVSMTVLPLGNVSAVRVTSDELGAPAVGECVRDIVASMRFVEGPMGEPLTYSFPFVFQPSEGGSVAE